jgi:hypothetical protein
MSDTKKRMKLALIAGASAAAKFMKDNRMATPDEAVRHVSTEADRIVDNIDE